MQKGGWLDELLEIFNKFDGSFNGWPFINCMLALGNENVARLID
jgi:hypothetical protein